MSYRRLWLLIEGNDEERFFNTMAHVFANKYDFVQTWQYAQEPAKRIKSALNSIRAMSSDYFFFQDMNRSPCVTERKERVRNKYGLDIALDSIVIVIKEIEAWYLAGLDDNSCKDLGIQPFASTNDVTKEEFNRLIPPEFDLRIDFMIEALKRFSVETAKQKNRSFAHFMNKILAA